MGPRAVASRRHDRHLSFRTLELDALNSMGAWNMLPVSAEFQPLTGSSAQKKHPYA